MPDTLILSIQELEKKRDEYRNLARQLRDDALANEGAAQALDVLLQESSHVNTNSLPENRVD